MKPQSGFIPTTTQPLILLQDPKKQMDFKPPSPADTGGVTQPWVARAAIPAQGAAPEEVDSSKDKRWPVPELLFPLLLRLEAGSKFCKPLLPDMQTRADQAYVYMYLHILFTEVSGINKINHFICPQGVGAGEKTL